VTLKLSFQIKVGLRTDAILENLLVESQLVGNRVQSSSSMSGMSISYHGVLIRKALNLSNKQNCPRSTPVVFHQLADLSLKRKKKIADSFEKHI
jgi:hypothetical protein